MRAVLRRSRNPGRGPPSHRPYGGVCSAPSASAASSHTARQLGGHIINLLGRLPFIFQPTFFFVFFLKTNLFILVNWAEEVKIKRASLGLLLTCRAATACGGTSITGSAVCLWRCWINSGKLDFLTKYVFTFYSTNFHHIISHWNPACRANGTGAANKWSIGEITVLVCWRLHSLHSLLLLVAVTKCYLIGPLWTMWPKIAIGHEKKNFDQSGTHLVEGVCVIHTHRHTGMHTHLPMASCVLRHLSPHVAVELTRQQPHSWIRLNECNQVNWLVNANVIGHCHRCCINADDGANAGLCFVFAAVCFVFCKHQTWRMMKVVIQMIREIEMCMSRREREREAVN